MKYLITGGAGFIGANLAKKALNEGNSVLIIDNLSRTGSAENLKWLSQFKGVTFFKTDIRDSTEVSRIIEKHMPDAIFHLAGQVAMTTSLTDPVMDFQINALGTVNILESVRKTSPDSIVIFASTNKVYGDLRKYHYGEQDTRFFCKEYPNGFNEDVPLEFSTPYGCSKGSADQYMIDYFRTFGIRTVSFRHSSMYGDRQFSTFDQGWIGWFVQKAIEKSLGREDTFTVSGSGKQVRDILHVNDVTDLYFKAIDSIDKIAGNAFNIGGGFENSLSILELLSLLEKELNVDLNFTKIPERLNDQKVFIADISLIKDTIQWTPKVSKESGIKRMVAWTINKLNHRGGRQV